MNEEELALDSDSSDEDYQPAGVENLSEDESGNESEEPCSDTEQNNVSGKKRKKLGKGRTRKKIRNTECKEEKIEEEKENSKTDVSPEDIKKKTDSLWADFLRECGPPAKKSVPTVKETLPVSDVPVADKVSSKKEEEKPKPEPRKAMTIMTFAGEEVKVPTEESPGSVPSKVGRSGGGLSSILSQIGKKGKLSTLEKSKLDWESFKTEQGIKEDLKTYNKGKNGYLEKQDFLQRADLRQFEIEKSMRASRRSLNR